MFVWLSTEDDPFSRRERLSKALGQWLGVKVLIGCVSPPECAVVNPAFPQAFY